MPRQVGQFVENNFVRGLVTEATGLSFPENACTETYDCIFNKIGDVERRKGFEYESSYEVYDMVTNTKQRDENAIATFLWKGAGGDKDASFLVVQLGQFIHFYSVATTLSANKNAVIIDLDNYDVTGSTLPYTHPCSFAQGDGKLFVVGRHIEPFYVDYTSSTETIDTGTQITIKERDFEGINSTNDSNYTYGVDDRPTATVITDTAVVNAHLYNLMNQGWADSVVTGSGTSENPVKVWDTGETTLPSNSDRWWSLKDATDYMVITQLDKTPVSTAEVPKGHFIFNAFNTDRQDETVVYGSDSSTGQEGFDTLWGRGGGTHKVSTLTSSSTLFRPTSVEFFANRVFYSGVDDSGYNKKVYFSQILTDIAHAGHCYQEQDPTSEEFSDLLPTDGGVIDVPGVANIIHMVASENSLFIFATNGIWVVTGSEGIGFTATDYSVSKISGINNIDNQSFVDLSGVPAWINAEGIWLLQEDKGLGSAKVTSLSKDTIQTFFDDEIPSGSLAYIKGEYNAKERLVYWLFRSTAATTTAEQYEYDRCLLFNTETGAFYPWKLNTDTDVKILDVVVSNGFGQEQSEENVYYGSTTTDLVTGAAAAQVVVNSLSATSVVGTTKFLTEDSGENITWSEQHDTDYLDWTTAKTIGKAYESYFITGYKVRGGGLKKQTSNYVRIHNRVETNSSVNVQGVWDYYTADGARWSTKQEGYKTGTNQTYSERRLKIRGSGLSLQLKFSSNAGVPFNIIGWAAEDSVNTKP